MIYITDDLLPQPILNCILLLGRTELIQIIQNITRWKKSWLLLSKGDITSRCWDPSFPYWWPWWNSSLWPIHKAWLGVNICFYRGNWLSGSILHDLAACCWSWLICWLPEDLEDTLISYWEKVIGWLTHSCCERHLAFWLSWLAEWLPHKWYFWLFMGQVGNVPWY